MSKIEELKKSVIKEFGKSLDYEEERVRKLYENGVEGMEKYETFEEVYEDFFGEMVVCAAVSIENSWKGKIKAETNYYPM